MADSSVPITAGSGTNIDTQTQPGGDHRQVVVVGDAVATNVAKVNTNGDLVASLSNPNSLAAGIYATLTPFGGLNVSADPTGLLTDTFDTSVIDTNKWTTAGSVPPTQAAGTMSVNPGTGANATSTLASQYAFSGATTIMVVASIAFENGGPATGCVRFFGFGLPPSVPGTFAAPIQDGVGIEITTAGVMRAVVYSAGSVVASGGTSVLAMPTNGAIHKYAVLVRGDIAFVYQDNFDVPAATLTLKPSVETLPVRIACLNSGSVPGFTPIMNVSGLAVLDWSRNAQGIADGTYPWRKAQVGKQGGLSIKGAAITGQTFNVTAATPVTGAGLDVSEAGNVTFIVKNTVAATAFTGVPVIVFEQSDDNVSWAPLIVTPASMAPPSSTPTMITGSANVEQVFDAAAEGVNWVRARVTTAQATNGMTVVLVPGGLLVEPSVAIAATPALTKGTQGAGGFSVQELKDAGRVAISWTLEFAPAAVAEALVTMTESRDGAAVTTFTTKVVTSGKRLRVQTWGMTCENTLGANPKRAKLRMKFNTGGAVTTASPLLANLVASVAGTVNTVGNEATQDFPDGLEFLGDGTKQIGFTLEFPDWVTAAQTGKVYVTIVAFEY